MIRNSKQNWTVGQTVKVGFLSLIVRAAIATPGDSYPDAYILVNHAGDKLYRFVPHNGVERITPNEARELLASAESVAARIAEQATARAQAAAAINSVFDLAAVS